MAEIKSTIDLIMEKTKHLVLSEEEKKTAEREEQLKKIPGYVQRFLDGAWDMNQLKTELGNLPVDLRDETARHLTKQFVMESNLEEKGKKCLEALEYLAQEKDRRWLNQFQDLISSFEKTKRKWVSTQEKQMRSDLAALGIKGTAVVVRPEKSPQWQAKEHDFQLQIEEIQTAWKAALGVE
jgi:hypothetical protein